MTKIIVFGYDAAEAAQIRRIRSYMACGFEVQGFTMRRDNMNSDFEPFWPNVHLGEVSNESLGRRVRTLGAALPVIRRNRGLLEGADVIVARNLDMLALAAYARSQVPGKRPPLIYECLDIHGIMTDPGRKGQLFRWMERRLLDRCASIIVSSPTFLSAYFEPYQHWTGPTTLLENKLWFEDGAVERPAPGRRPPAPPDAPIRLGWVGTLRCPRSLALLAEAARRMGPKLELRLHGVVHSHALPDFDAVVAAHDNITYLGPYDYPAGLAAVYDDCDLVWSQDLWQWGTNSTWLLPNRIYEASYFGCPSVAVAGTATGDRVERGLGWTVPEPEAGALVALLEGLGAEDLAAARDALLTRPEGDFRLSHGEVCEAIQAVL
jgi:succinoglycan biosynthesis protein ExoL